MSKRNKSHKHESGLTKPVENSNPNPDFTPSDVKNGLGGAIFGVGFPGQGYGFGGPETQSIAQPTQIFNGLRWYFVSNLRQALSEAYVELGLVKTVVDVPVDDAFKGGIKIESKQLSPDQLKQLHDLQTREDDEGKLSQAKKWNRLFGGAGVLVLTDQDPSSPLDVNALSNAKLEYRAVDMWELYFDLQNMEGYDPAIQNEKFEYYSYYGQKVHKSRVFPMRGQTAPSFLRPRLRGWGFSVVESIVRSINQYLLGTQLIYELLDEAKIDVFGLKNLTNTLLAPNGTARVAERIQIANREKNYQHALVMDAEDNYDQKTLTFSGVADIMREIRMQVASELRMPVTKLFGTSDSGGLNNTDQNDMENYNNMLEGSVRKDAKLDYLKMTEYRCMQLFGFIPDDLSAEFQPLRELSAEQKSKIDAETRNGLLALFTAGVISLEEIRDGLNKDSLAVIQLDNAMLPEGSDEVGNIPGVDEDSINGEAADEASRDTLGASPPGANVDEQSTEDADDNKEAKD